MSITRFADIADLTEDQRIAKIGQHAQQGLRVAFVVETHAKADRYLRKIRERFPNVCEIERADGPVEGVVTVRVGLASN